MRERVTAVLSGIGGYGEIYLKALLSEAGRERVALVGAVDPQPERCRRLDELRALGVPIFASLEAFYAERSAQLAVIAAPIHEHCPQTCLALERGSHVLCEKPLAATVQDADRMAAARDRAGRSVAIGYQWSFSPAILGLKRDVMAGRYGRPRRLTALVLWPRDRAYYQRNDWAGRQRAPNGAWVLDSPVNNAAAHYLHNMLFVLGDAVDRSARPAGVQAELYRANPIDNYDTAALRCVTDRGVEILFYVSHAVQENAGPMFDFEFERGTVRYDGPASQIVGRLDDGQVVDYGSPDEDDAAKLWAAVDAAARGGPVPCGIEAARAHTLVMNGAQESCPIADFGPLARSVDGPSAPLMVVEGLAEALLACKARRQLPSEAGYAWARAGRVVDLAGYDHFPGRA